MAPTKQPRRGWTERTVRLTRATATVFTGPGDDFTIVVAGKRLGRGRVELQRTRPSERKGAPS